MELKQMLCRLLPYWRAFGAKSDAREELDAADDEEDIAQEDEEFLGEIAAQENRDGYLLYREREDELCIRLDLREGVTRVGRLNSMDYILQAPGVSAKHAEFTRSPDCHYFIQDFSADGETYIDGARIPGGKRELRSGDVVQLGEARMEFRLRFLPDVPQSIAIPANEAYEMKTDSLSRRKKGLNGGAQCMDIY